jgi:hypothetical protein
MSPSTSKIPYRITFPDSSESPQSTKTLERALHSASWRLNRVWKEDCQWGKAGEPTTDADRAIITNRETGYRWIVRRGHPEVEFQTPEMAEKLVREQGINLYLTVEEIEALARSVKGREPQDTRQAALADQALDQIAYVCQQVRNRVDAGDRQVDHRFTSLPRTRPRLESTEAEDESEGEEETAAGLSYRPLGDPDNLSFKEAGQILGKARNTLHGWYRDGKFPPAVDVGPYLGQSKPVLVVPRYRLEAWQAGERMPPIFQEVFKSHALREPPWQCWSVRKGASKQDVTFWVTKRDLKEGRSKTGKRIFGDGLEHGVLYDLPT